MIQFSVAIPLYNKANFIQNCLESILKQTHKEFEVILVNDGSTDGCETVVEKFQDSRIRLVHQEIKELQQLEIKLFLWLNTSGLL